MKLPVLPACAVLVAVLGGGCVPFTAASGLDDDLFAPLIQRDLPRFEQQIALREHSATADGWTQVAAAWLALANCDELPSTPPAAFAPGERLEAFVWASLVAEDARRRMLVGRVSATNERPGETQFRYLHSEAFFVREAGEIPAELIRWPAAEEGWPDEVPAAVDEPSNCADFPARALLDEDGEKVSYEASITKYLDAVASLDAAFRALSPAQRTGAPAAIHWKTMFYAAEVENRVGAAWNKFALRAEEAVRAGRATDSNTERAQTGQQRAQQYLASARDRLAALVDAAPDSVEPAEVGRARLIFATRELQKGRTAVALSLLAAVRDTDLSEDDFWTARYLELRVASDAARWREAAAMADGLPPRTSPLYGPYHYRVAVALRRIDASDRFLQVAMKAFRDMPYKADPFLRALYVEMLQTLAEYPFEPRIVELLEELGQRSGTFERIEEYARVALDRGRSENAEAAATYLLANHHDARFHPGYQAIRALAAFLQDNPSRFAARVRDVVQRPDAVLSAIPETRRATFFAHADTELARILRQMLPVMAEWGDSEPARQRREKWLKMIVSETQRFLRESQDTLARPQLVELYRLASGLLEDHPRGYAERVGVDEPTPLVLGTVRVERRDLERFEPHATVSTPEPFSLTLLPSSDAPPSEWKSFWPRQNQNEEGAP